jgi:hypothetical protein
MVLHACTTLKRIFSSKDAIVNQDRGEGNRLDTAVNVPDRTMEHLLTVQAVVRVKYSPRTLY